MAGRKVDLATLGQRAKETIATTPPGSLEPPPWDTPAVETPTERPSRRQVSRREPKHPAPGEWVRYDELERKEARLRIDQYGQLSDLSRRLNRARGGRGERITENTLIRVAIDLLLARQSDLAGATELELRKSVGL
jgi:hypothetical protein